MLVYYQKYYTPLDKFINKLKRKGFWLYTGMIAISVLYLFYEISNLPNLPPLPPPPQKPTNTKHKDHTKLTKIIKTEKIIPSGENEEDQPEVVVKEETIIEN
ncbi:hypothetical protein KGF54_001477 [Candida jiufengensis]|uniref:uncharacterized protein n=1 Tax=Candida jiufengensis TaxID=497108 RepID=UPI002224825B|nr:uncharacterized protein KGF54_001477 [Candida jiufengensis]KAI5954916.1 hypothetical protein KGF54_001477 [Candida jiufengensis]